MAKPTSKSVATSAPPTPKPRKYSKLRNPAVERKDESGKTYVRRPNGDKHYAPEGADTGGMKAWRSAHNYETSDERKGRLAATKTKRAAIVSEREKSFTVTPSGENSAHVNWNEKTSKSPKPSVAKTHAHEILTSAGPRTYKSAPAQASKSNTVMTSAGPREYSGRSPEPAGTSTHPAASKAQFTPHATKTDNPVATTRPQPAAKSFDTHANEAMSIANSGKSFSEHADEAISVANSGRSTSKQSSKTPATATPKSAPVDNRSKITSQREATKTSAPKEATPKNKRSYPELDKAIKVQSKYKSAEAAHAQRTSNRAKGVESLAPKKQDKLDSLVNGPRSKPTRGPVTRLAYRGAAKVSQAVDDRQLAGKRAKYESAVGKAKVAHDQQKAGTYTGNTLPKRAGRAVGRAAGKAVVAGSKYVAHAVVETAKGDLNAARLAHHELKGGRAPKPSGQANRNVSSRQFGSRNGDE